MYKEKSAAPNNCDAFSLLIFPYAQSPIFVHRVSLQTPYFEPSKQVPVPAVLDYRNGTRYAGIMIVSWSFAKSLLYTR